MVYLLYVLLPVVFLFGRSAQAFDWYLNGMGPSAPYQIWAYRDDGFPSSIKPVIPLPSGASALAWPSAIQVGSIVRVYASVKYESWSAVRLWTSHDGINFADQGVVFTSNSDEPHGIGPTYVMYEPSVSEPYKMYYLVRGASGPGPSIAVATSTDGINWTRYGKVISASLTEEAGGLSMSYACRRANGNYVLVYHGYSSDLSKGVALVAQANSPTSTFTGKTIIKSYDGFDATINAAAGRNFGTVPSGITVPLGIPLLVLDENREQIVAKAQDSTRVWFDRPFLYSHSSTPIYSMARRKVEASYLKELWDGSWKGIFTIYNPVDNVAAEYTTEASASSLTGTWSYTGSGFRFQPWIPDVFWSIENPTPLLSHASCAN